MIELGGLGLVVFGSGLARSEILRVGQRVSKKKEVEVIRQGRYCHSGPSEATLWRRTCLEPKIHACDFRIATQLILRFAQNDNSFFIRHVLHHTFWTASQNDKTGLVGLEGVESAA
jgi:hypothetical protein